MGTAEATGGGRTGPAASGRFEAEAGFRDILSENLTALGTAAGYFVVVYATHIAFARILSVEDYGDYSIAMKTLHLGSIVALIGAGQASTRYLPAYLAAREWPRISGFVRFFVPFVLVLAIAVGGLLWLVGEYGQPLFRDRDFERYFHPIAVAGLAIPIYTLAMLLTKVVRGFGFVAVSMIPNRIVSPLVALAIVGAIWWTGRPIHDWVIVAAVAVAGLVAIAIFTVVLARMESAFALVHPPAYETRTWLRFCLPIMVTMMLAELLQNIDLLMVEFLATDEDAVGHFAAVGNTVWVLMTAFTAALAALMPWLGAAAERRDRGSLQRLLGMGLGIVVVPTVLAGALLIVFREQVLGLFGAGYRTAGTAFVLMTVAYLVAAAFGLSRTFLEFLGHARLVVAIVAGAALLNVGLNALLVPRYGIDGAAAATLTALAGVALVTTVLLATRERLLAIPFWGWLLGGRPAHTAARR